MDIITVLDAVVRGRAEGVWSDTLELAAECFLLTELAQPIRG